MGKFKKRKDGRYATTVMNGYKPDGRPNTIFVSAKTEKQLREKVLAVQMSIKQNLVVKTSDTPLAEYAKNWKDTYKSAVGINTKAMYDNIVNHYIIPSIGHLPLNQIRRSDIQGMINDNQTHARTCEQIKMTIVQILNSAIDDSLLVENVAKKVVLPKRKKAERRALTEQEKTAIKTADLTETERAFVLFLFYTGLRRGEALALTKADINLKEKTVSVNKAVVFDVNKSIVKDGAKSDAGNRTIPLPDAFIAFLRPFLRSLDTFYLFPGKNGETYSKTQYVHMWNSITKNLNNAVTSDREKAIGAKPIQGLTAHIFRHNYCTMLYYSGISQKKAVELMGHSDLKMIMEVYAHLDEQKEAVRDKINNAIAL